MPNGAAAKSPASPAKIATALVTGASGGIGRAVSRALATAGVRVALVARSSADLAEAAAEIDAASCPGAALPFPADVTDAGAVARVVAQSLAVLGDIDLLVNAAGAVESAPYSRTTTDLLGRLLAVNLYAPHHTMSALLPSMKKRGRGAIINIASTAGLRGYPYVSAYAASKHALVGLTRSIAEEMAGSGVRVNAICPGYVDTPMLDRSVDQIVEKTGRSRDEVRESLGKMNASGRLLDPDEIAAVATWLVTGDGATLNGEAVVVDGLADPWAEGAGLPIHADALGEARGYSHGMLFRAGRTLFVAGQVAWDRDHRIVGIGDFSAQFDVALGNVLRVVREAGGRPDQIGRLRIYVSDRDLYLASLKGAGHAYRKHMGAHYPAMALVEVSRLLEEGALVEIEAEAIL